jgi:hypothetical protein
LFHFGGCFFCKNVSTIFSAYNIGNYFNQLMAFFVGGYFFDFKLKSTQIELLLVYAHDRQVLGSNPAEYWIEVSYKGPFK